jgi:two-component system alkaline phosphatase synthesis response regulator PhoP
MDKKKILVVDDEPNIVKTVESRLKASGYDVVAAYDGEECLDKVHQEKPDLIILDLMLPKLNGHEIHKKLKADNEYKDIPVVMLTASAELNDIKTGMETGADGYITKPFKAEVLLGIIQGLLGT